MLVEFLLIGLAAFRVANLFVNESGPWDIFEKLRTFVGIKPGPVEGFFPNLFSCMYCMTVWTSVLSYFLWQVEPIIVAVIAAMTIALLAHAVIDRGS